MSYPALERALYHVLKAGIPIEESLLSDALKTVDWYERAMWKGVRELYDGAISTYEFESLMIDIISNQLRRAWNEGMRELGLNPEEDQTMEGEMFLQNLMAEELVHVGPLAVDIRAEVSLTNPDITQFRNRVQMWANRYNDTVNQAIAFYSNNEHYPSLVEHSSPL